ncbi:MAG: prepilin-type N-terminal cleavage/methylation domain-containing protein [Synergistales bacterium]|nr:prepilin-type N-terminal cleavage/methylation domain-containing protein [Synergistales bacterium]
MLQKFTKKKRQGFTLVELLIVIIIIGILAGALLLVAGASQDKAAASKVITNLRTAKTAALMYYADQSPTAWPTAMDQLLGYTDRELSTDLYEIVSNSQGTNVFYYVTYEAPELQDPGVQKKLIDAAAEAGVLGSTDSSTPPTSADVFYNGEGAAAMILRIVQ